MEISNKITAPLPPFLLDGCELPVVKGYKYLGLFMTQLRDRWSSHIDRVYVSGNRATAAYAMRAVALGYPVKVCMMIWKAMVRPILEYGAEVLWPKKNDMKKLEKLQDCQDSGGQY